MTHPDTAALSASAPPRLAVVVPCFNEQEVLPETMRRLDDLLARLEGEGLIAPGSFAAFVDDGSTDGTWAMIEAKTQTPGRFAGIKLSRNRGHQNALLAGLLTVGGDVIISMDSDLQDDPEVARDMLLAWRDEGADIVYGVRATRATDTTFKRLTAEGYYRLLEKFGVDIVFNHADYRLMSRRAVEALREFGEVNLFLRGIIPMLGFTTRTVPYARGERFAGESKYPLKKMAALAIDGITSFSVAPLRWITLIGFVMFLCSFLIGLWGLATRLFGWEFVRGWTSMLVTMTFLGGIQMLSLGVIGEYLGKIYLESKRRPRFVIEKTVGPTMRRGGGG
jgi:glycosyltransferase involved in cell wall biosynthesis